MLAALDDLGRKARRDVEPIMEATFARRLGKRAPALVIDRLMQGQLDLGLASPRGQARRQHAGVVEHQEVVRPEKLVQIGNAMITERLRLDPQQPSALARRGRTLGDQLLRQGEIEVWRHASGGHRPRGGGHRPLGEGHRPRG